MNKLQLLSIHRINMEHASFLLGLSAGLFIIYIVSTRPDVICANTKDSLCNEGGRCIKNLH